MKQYVPGQQITLERNPYYWKEDGEGNRLPYLDEVVSLFVGDANAEAMRLERGDVDIVNRLSSADFSVLETHQEADRLRLYDIGPGLEFNFLFFNLNDLTSRNLPSIAARQAWFRQLAFRQAVSAAIDRDAIVQLVYRGRAYPLSGAVTPGDKLWLDRNIPPPSHSLARARQILQNAGFSWSSDQRLLDAQSQPVKFSIIFNAGNSQHTQIATLIQEDLKQVGMDVNIVPLEFHALIARVFNGYEYDAALMALVGGDADPNSEMNVWTSQGSTHLWDLTPERTRPRWQEEIDDLMQRQMVTLDFERRKHLYDEVQELLWKNLPLIYLTSPNILVGASERLRNFRPAILNNYTLWNVEELFIRR